MDRSKNGARNLAEQIARGNREAEHELVVAYYSPLLSRLRKRLRSLASAEDVCQETFVIAIRKLRRGDIRDPGKVGGFVTGIAERLILAHAKANRLFLQLTDKDANALVAFGPRPLEATERAIEDRMIRRAVSELRCARDRDLLLRRYWLDQNGPEIQRSLRLSSVVFKKAISRARSRVRHILICETDLNAPQ